MTDRRPMERRLREILSTEPSEAGASPREGLADELRAKFVSGSFDADRVVRSAPGPGADPEFRTRLRAAFTGGALGQGTADGVDASASDRALRGVLAGEPAAGRFRSRLRAQFVLGELDQALPADGAESPAADPSGLPATAAGSEEVAAPIHDFGAARRRLAPLIAVAVAAVALFAFILPTILGPTWRVHRGPSDATAVLFDRAPVGQAGEQLDVDTGRILSCGPEALRLALGERALLEIEQNSQIRFCAPVFRLFDSSLAPVHLDKGEVNVRTLPEADLALTIDTPNVVVHLEDGAVSVRATDEGTCIVVFDGQVEVVSAVTGERRVVTADDRYWASRCGTRCRLDEDLVNSSADDAVDRTRAARAMFVDIEAGIF